MDLVRYAAAACQTDFANPLDRPAMRANTDRMLSMIDSAIAGSAPFLPVRLVAFPEFAHAAPVFASAAELLDRLAVPIPNEHTDRIAAKAREHGIYVQTGSMIERAAATKCAIRSLGSSSPIARRIVVGRMPLSASAAALNSEWVVSAGQLTIVFDWPRLIM